ncbi:hypothetical protein P3S68_012796 [Capsicum galapagoense]
MSCSLSITATSSTTLNPNPIEPDPTSSKSTQNQPVCSPLHASYARKPSRLLESDELSPLTAQSRDSRDNRES